MRSRPFSSDKLHPFDFDKFVSGGNQEPLVKGVDVERLPLHERIYPAAPENTHNKLLS